MIPDVWVDAMFNAEVALDGSMLFVKRVFLMFVFPDTSKLNDGSSVFTPTKPEPPAAYKDIRSLVSTAVVSFSIPIVRRPAFVVVVPDKSWYFIYA